MENQNHIVSDEALVKHFAYIGLVTFGVALLLGSVANLVG